MSRKYFGTDGIRGRVGVSPMSADFVLRLGWAAGRVLAAEAPETGRHRKVLIGKDTRVSGYLFESALEAGLSSAGVDVVLLGPIPTPAVAALVQEEQADAGIVISASHNPFHDNGIKFFGPDGRKLSDAVELAIEARLGETFETVDSEQLGKAARMNDATDRYIEFCRQSVPRELRLAGMKIAFDGANGAGYQAGPKLLRALDAEVVTVGCEPDGMNINRDVGSTHPEALVDCVKREGADLGIALDGDGDRVLMVDADGRIYDGDELVYAIASHRHQAGTLKGPVIGTLMTNLAIEQALKAEGIEFHRAKVGDRYVMELLDKHHGEVGGEGSGHILCLDKHSTGDGLIAALQVLEALKASGKSLAGFLGPVQKFPQTLVNVRVEERPAMDHPEIVAAVSAAEGRLAADGRVLLRPSGTEPVIRVMVEGADPALVGQLAKELAQVVENAANNPD
ncbi:MAG: phosphoglucosamine mutase [Gammaproteobacteria bacterium]|nr:phosphoglucosamine mutase [Gammaproteobacteria bacterium]